MCLLILYSFKKQRETFEEFAYIAKIFLLYQEIHLWVDSLAARNLKSIVFPITRLDYISDSKL